MRLAVYSGGVRVGTLDMAAGEPFYGFAYDAPYLSSGAAAPLSLSLPLQEGRFDGFSALPFFEGLLPEGDVRAAVARQLGISERSPAKLLRALGRDCAGDVAVLEEDDPYQPPADDEYAPLEGGLERIAANPFGEISRLRAGGRLSLAGGQEKIALYHDGREPLGRGWWVPLGGSPSTHIVKPQVHDAYPQLVHNEFFCMRLAKHAGIDAAEVDLVTPGRPMLVIGRFDRASTGRTGGDGLSVYRRLRQEDFCQALGFDSSRKYEADGGPGVADMRGLLLAHSARFIQDGDALLKLVLFNYLVGNCDAHAKNYSVMLGAGGAVRLAPAYDLVSTTAYDGTFGSQLARGMGMRIGAHANIDRVTAEDFPLLASDLGTSAKRLRGAAAALAEALPAAADAAAAELAERAREDASELVGRIRGGIESRSRVVARF